MGAPSDSSLVWLTLASGLRECHTRMPEVFDDVGHCVDAVLKRVGTRVVLAMPLGIGKPNPLANEFYRRARLDPAIDLTIVTALSLLKPAARSPLEGRLLTPLIERVFGSYVEPDYARAMHDDALPGNVRVIEFFLAPGAFLGSRQAQRHYLSANYTHVAREVLARGVNVIAHLVARRTVNSEMQLSFGSNPDVTVDLLPLIESERTPERDIVMVGETHAQMPFMTGRALVAPGRFDFLIDSARYDYDLFGPPNPPLGTVDHAIGVYASALVRDGGTLQVGIGEMGDSLVYALLLRHQQNAAWRSALAALGAPNAAALLAATGGEAPFASGLYACTEMFVDQLLELHRAGILRRRVYDSLLIERLLSSGSPGERLDEGTLGALAATGAGPVLGGAEFAELKAHGVFREDVEFGGGRVRARGGGQYNFVAMAHALTDARSILCVRATRTRGGRTTSNLLWSYGHATIPRHLRDIVVTEYGIADIRGRTDEETIAALLNVADSRFQEELLSRARAAGKIRADYRIPEAFRNNFPGRLELALESHRRQGYFSEYPFGTDLTGDEIALARALKYLERRTGSALARLGTAAAALGARPAERHASALKRMGLDTPRDFRERLLQRLVVLGLDAGAV